MQVENKFLSESTKGEPLLLTGLAAVSTVSRAAAGGVATIVSATHSLVTGDIVYISGVTDTAYNGVHKITKVNTTTFTYPLVHATETTASDTGGTVQKITKLHTAQAELVDTNGKITNGAMDEITLYASNIHTSAVVIGLLIASTSVVTYISVASKAAFAAVLTKLRLNKASIIYGFAATASVVYVHATVDRITE